MHFRISPEGKVYDVRPVKGSPVLAEAAVEAVQTWCYEPARLNGAAIDSQASTNFDFKLELSSRRNIPKPEGSQMYKTFFGLKENPFNINTDPRYLYLTERTQEALNCLTLWDRSAQRLHPAYRRGGNRQDHAFEQASGVAAPAAMPPPRLCSIRE